MALSMGQVLRGSAASYHITQVLKYPTVYQAQIIPFELNHVSQVPKLVAIKHFPKHISKTQYTRELRNYSFQSIASSTYIRSMIDTIGHDQNAVSEDRRGRNVFRMDGYRFIVAAIASLSDRLRPAPHSGQILTRSSGRRRRQGGVHRDVNPNNVFLSDVYGPAPVVKPGGPGKL